MKENEKIPSNLLEIMGSVLSKNSSDSEQRTSTSVVNDENRVSSFEQRRRFVLNEVSGEFSQERDAEEETEREDSNSPSPRGREDTEESADSDKENQYPNRPSRADDNKSPDSIPETEAFKDSDVEIGANSEVLSESQIQHEHDELLTSVSDPLEEDELAEEAARKEAENSDNESEGSPIQNHFEEGTSGDNNSDSQSKDEEEDELAEEAARKETENSDNESEDSPIQNHFEEGTSGDNNSDSQSKDEEEDELAEEAARKETENSDNESEDSPIQNHFEEGTSGDNNSDNDSQSKSSTKSSHSDSDNRNSEERTPKRKRDSSDSEPQQRRRTLSTDSEDERRGFERGAELDQRGFSDTEVYLQRNYSTSEDEGGEENPNKRKRLSYREQLEAYRRKHRHWQERNSTGNESSETSDDEAPRRNVRRVHRRRVHRELVDCEEEQIDSPPLPSSESEQQRAVSDSSDNKDDDNDDEERFIPSRRHTTDDQQPSVSGWGSLRSPEEPDYFSEPIKVTIIRKRKSLFEQQSNSKRPSVVREETESEESDDDEERFIPSRRHTTDDQQPSVSGWGLLRRPEEPDYFSEPTERKVIRKRKSLFEQQSNSKRPSVVREETESEESENKESENEDSDTGGSDTEKDDRNTDKRDSDTDSDTAPQATNTEEQQEAEEEQQDPEDPEDSQDSQDSQDPQDSQDSDSDNEQISDSKEEHKELGQTGAWTSTPDDPKGNPTQTDFERIVRKVKLFHEIIDVANEVFRLGSIAHLGDFTFFQTVHDRDIPLEVVVELISRGIVGVKKTLKVALKAREDLFKRQWLQGIIRPEDIKRSEEEENLPYLRLDLVNKLKFKIKQTERLLGLRLLQIDQEKEQLDEQQEHILKQEEQQRKQLAQKLLVLERVRLQKEQHRLQQCQVEREREERQEEEQRRLQLERNLERQKEDYNRQLRLQREQEQIKLRQQEEIRKRDHKRKDIYNSYYCQLPKHKHEPMQNEMVSIPVANLNGGLKAASSGSGVVGVVTSGGVVSSAVLANAPRVYLTPSSTFMANRGQVSSAAVATGKIAGSVIGGGVASSGTSSATGTVRYFSQFSKMQTAGGPSLQRKLANGDTIVLAANGNKSLYLSNDKASSVIATNGNSLLTAKTELLEEEVMQPGTVIVDCDDDDDEDEDDEDGEEDEKNNSHTAKTSGVQQEQPLALTTATTNNAAASDDEPELDIVINNVVCSFSVGCHLKLREIALQGSNVEYRRENGMVTMKLRHPYTTASIWSSGRITCTGATSEAMAKVAARRYARTLGKLGFPTRFLNFRIVNVLGTCSMPWAIKIVNFSERHRENASYEPELHPGVTYKMRDPDPKATLKIFSTGSVTVTAASVSHVESAIQHIYPLVFEFRKQRSPEELQHLRAKQHKQAGGDPAELEKLIVAENKAAGLDNVFINTTAAHTKPSPNEHTPATSGILTSNIDSMQRLKQIENYSHMMKLTQEERRHIPFQGEKVNPAASTSAAAAAASSASSGDNICANARRRATECWATKLQYKRPRYNDPGTTGSVNASSSSASSSASASVPATATAASSSSQAAPHLRTNPLKTAALANARMRGAKVPTVGGMVLKPGTRLAPIGGGSYLQQQHLQQQQQHLQQQLQQQQKMRQTSFSPSEFDVDDLIEEEESNELDMQY